MVTQEELNSRIVEDSDKILLIFKDYRRLNLYRRNFGRDSRKILLTDYDLENNGLVGLRYYNWHYVDDRELNNMINELYARNGYKKLQQENQQYKNAWEELKNDCREVEKANDYILYERLQQLEKKYNIGGE
ncbi:MAG TPA: hypothetical protein GX708_22365 [Gallicola sp.]|nr:hypothetical protein [Gallicola sp.]